MAKNRINVREKFGDYLLDISKYILTAVMITIFFSEVSFSSWVVYIVGFGGAVMTLFLGLICFHKSN